MNRQGDRSITLISSYLTFFGSFILRCICTCPCYSSTCLSQCFATTLHTTLRHVFCSGGCCLVLADWGDSTIPVLASYCTTTRTQIEDPKKVTNKMCGCNTDISSHFFWIFNLRQSIYSCRYVSYGTRVSAPRIATSSGIATPDPFGG